MWVQWQSHGVTASAVTAAGLAMYPDARGSGLGASVALAVAVAVSPSLQCSELLFSVWRAQSWLPKRPGDLCGPVKGRYAWVSPPSDQRGGRTSPSRKQGAQYETQQEGGRRPLRSRCVWPAPPDAAEEPQSWPCASANASHEDGVVSPPVMAFGLPGNRLDEKKRAIMFKIHPLSSCQ